jgi:hypothetical protein
MGDHALIRAVILVGDAAMRPTVVGVGEVIGTLLARATDAPR